MNKKDLIKVMAEKMDTTQKVATEWTEKFFEAMLEGMKEDTIVDIYGFAKFESVFKESRECRNPQTGETMMTKAAYAPKVKFYKKAKEFLND